MPGGGRRMKNEKKRSDSGSGRSGLPEGFDALDRTAGGKEAGSVRRYAMTRQQRAGWLGKYMRDSESVDPDAVGRKKKTEEDFTEKEKTTAKKIIRAFVILFTLILMAGTAFFVTGRMKLETVSVEGDTRYTAAELLEASGIGYGDLLLTARLKAKNPADSLTLLEYCRIGLSLPDTIVFEVKESVPSAYTEIFGSWFSLSSDLKVLGTSGSPEEYEEAGLVRVVLPEVSLATTGSRIELSGGADSGYITDFIGMISGSDFSDRCDILYLDSKYGIVMNVDGSFRLIFGSSGKKEIKLDAARRVIEEEIAAGTASAVIDLTDPSAVGVKRVTSIDPMAKE